MSTIADLLKEHNELAFQLGEPELNTWKKAKDLLQGRIDGMREELAKKEPEADPLAMDDDVQAIADAQDEEFEEALAKETPPPAEKGPTIGDLVKELLLDDEGLSYELIVEAVHREFPDAKTSRRSVASTAASLRKKGIDVPTRRKGRPAEADA